MYIKNYINKEAVKRNYNDLLPPLNFSNILPIIKEKKEKHEKNKKSKEKFNKNKLLMEIKPLPSKRSNQILIDKRLSKEKEYDLNFLVLIFLLSCSELSTRYCKCSIVGMLISNTINPHLLQYISCFPLSLIRLVFPHSMHLILFCSKFITFCEITLHNSVN